MVKRGRGQPEPKTPKAACGPAGRVRTKETASEKRERVTAGLGDAGSPGDWLQKVEDVIAAFNKEADRTIAEPLVPDELEQEHDACVAAANE